MNEKECIEGAGRPMAHSGHKRVTRNGITTLAHRQAWEDAYGAIPEGLVVHHLCENQACVQLDHLSLMTRAQHARLHLQRDICKNGHARTPENLYANGACKKCSVANLREWRARRRAA